MSRHYCHTHHCFYSSECDLCIRLERDRFRDALSDIATTPVNVENHGACALVDKALHALQS